MNNKYLYVLIVCLFSIATFFLLNYKITKTPPGLTIDEASIGYNAYLIGKTGSDETGRYLPLFALTIHGSDWKQPSSIYATAIFFKFFGASIYKLRLVSVITCLVSLLLIIYLGNILLGRAFSLISALLFISSPIVFMHSHLAQENIMPLPFVLAWLIFTLLHQKSNFKSARFILLAAISLGMSIYSYKGMRAVVPSLIIISLVYQAIVNKTSFIRSTVFFVLGLAPFILIMPWINTHYAGALFSTSDLRQIGFYDFIYTYLSNFDVSSLFVAGDITPWHSTGFHGVFLLSSLPFFVYGLVFIIQNKDLSYQSYWLFLVASFIASPLLFGKVASVHRFSRLLVFAPFYALISGLGAWQILKQKKYFLATALSLLVVCNFFSFINYYWHTYPVIKSDSFGQNTESSYKKLAEISLNKSQPVYVFQDDYLSQGEDSRFFAFIHLNDTPKMWKPNDVVPSGSIIMARLGDIKGFNKFDSNGQFNFFERINESN